MTPSFQLPELIALSGAFELRTNPCCRSVTAASEIWLFSLKTEDLKDVITIEEQKALRCAKTGLLAALCFPTCDAPQLQLLTDFLNVLIISSTRLLQAHTMAECGWQTDDSAIPDEFCVGHRDGLDCLTGHALFKYLTPRLRRLASAAPQGWQARFTDSVLSFRSAQKRVIQDNSTGVIPQPQSYIDLRRNLGGFKIIFNLVELVEIITMPNVMDSDSQRLVALQQYANDIIAWSLDIVSYNIDQAQGNKHNLITVLIAHENLSVQAAVNSAADSIRKTLGSFLEAEHWVRDLPRSPQPALGLKLSSLWSWALVKQEPPRPEASELQRDEAVLADIHSYVQSLKDRIIGTINWAYETEIYFGLKGEEIRTFGWVFMNQKEEG